MYFSQCSVSCGDGVQFRRVSCEGGYKCRDALEPEQIQTCRGHCQSTELATENANNASNSSDPTITTLVPLAEPEINNDIINLLLPSSTPTTKNVEKKRPDFYVDDKIQPENLKIMEMQIVTASPSALPDINSNDVELSDEALANQRHSYKKMSVHIGEDAALYLAKINVQSDQPGEPSIDVSKIKPAFKWKIGLWTRV